MEFVKSEKTQKSPLAKLYKKLSPKSSKKNLSSPSFVSEEESRNSTSSGSNSGEIDELELKAVFDCIDANSDGKISAFELQNSVSLLGGALSAREAEAVVNLSDLNGDGFLDFEEFMSLMKGKECSEEEKRKELMEAFGMYAPDGSEFITAASLRRTLSRLGESRTVEDCKSMIRAFDVNGDGVLSFDEFALMMR